MQTEGTKLGEACGGGRRWQQVTSRINIDGIKGNEPLACRSPHRGGWWRRREGGRERVTVAQKTSVCDKLIYKVPRARLPATHFTIISLLLFSVSIIVPLSLSFRRRAVHFHACDAELPRGECQIATKLFFPRLRWHWQSSFPLRRGGRSLSRYDDWIASFLLFLIAAVKFLRIPFISLFPTKPTSVTGLSTAFFMSSGKEETTEEKRGGGGGEDAWTLCQRPREASRHAMTAAANGRPNEALSNLLLSFLLQT